MDHVRNVFDAARGAVEVASERCIGQIGVAAQVCMNGPYVVFSGMGKSGFIAMKAAATLRSLGKPSMYLHPSEASHGDLGLLTSETVVLVVSNSGETPELADLLVRCQTIGAKVIAVTGNKESSLAQAAKCHIVYGHVAEACPHGLAPTTSTTVQQVILDALAVQIGLNLGTTPDDFREYHPGGTLGQKIKTAGEVMTPLSEVPRIPSTASLGQYVGSGTNEVQGVALVDYPDGRVGIVTDGDFRRHYPSHGISLIQDLATRRPHMVPVTMLLPDVVADFNRLRITAAPVYDASDEIVGLVHMHSLLKGK